jgi:hypothetical protein
MIKYFRQRLNNSVSNEMLQERGIYMYECTNIVWCNIPFSLMGCIFSIGLLATIIILIFYKVIRW